MNRRSFLSSIIKAGVGAAVLPSALTYSRTWKPLESGIYTMEWSAQIRLASLTDSAFSWYWVEANAILAALWEKHIFYAASIK